MNNPRYKAFVFLPPYKNEDGVAVYPSLQTHSFSEKQPVLDFVNMLFNLKMIAGYRMLISPDGREHNYYHEPEVEYLPEGHKIQTINGIVG